MAVRMSEYSDGRQSQGADELRNQPGHAVACYGTRPRRFPDSATAAGTSDQQFESAFPLAVAAHQKTANAILDCSGKRFGGRRHRRHAHQRSFEEFELALAFTKRISDFQRGDIYIGLTEAAQHIGRWQKADPLDPLAVPLPVRPEIEIPDQP